MLFYMKNLLLITLPFLRQMSVAVQINYIKVPTSVRNNTHKPIILDCNYSVRPDDTDLVLKWFHNEEVVYQWIPPKKPQTLGVLKNRVDLKYQASTDPKMAFRAMKILNPTTDIAGTYKCLVSTFADEDFSEKSMTVFEPERALVMLEGRPNDYKTNFTCVAEDVYPKPRISLYRDRKDDVINKNPLEAIEWDTIKQGDGRYTTFTTATAKLIDLYPGDLINCELRIPSTGYVKRKSLIYYPTDLTLKNGGTCNSQFLYIYLLFLFII